MKKINNRFIEDAVGQEIWSTFVDDEGIAIVYKDGSISYITAEYDYDENVLVQQASLDGDYLQTANGYSTYKGTNTKFFSFLLENKIVDKDEVIAEYLRRRKIAKEEIANRNISTLIGNISALSKEYNFSDSDMDKILEVVQIAKNKKEEIKNGE